MARGFSMARLAKMIGAGSKSYFSRFSKLMTKFKFAGRFVPFLNWVFLAWTLWDIADMFIGSDEDADDLNNLPPVPRGIQALLLTPDYAEIPSIALARISMYGVDRSQSLGIAAAYYIFAPQYISSLSGCSALHYAPDTLSEAIKTLKSSDIPNPFSEADVPTEEELSELRDEVFLSYKNLDFYVYTFTNLNQSEDA